MLLTKNHTGFYHTPPKRRLTQPKVVIKPVRAIRRACKNNGVQMHTVLFAAGIRFGVPTSRANLINFLGTLSRPQLERVLAVVNSYLLENL